jgi:uncharacterized protein (DUF2384 family)
MATPKLAISKSGKPSKHAMKMPQSVALAKPTNLLKKQDHALRVPFGNIEMATTSQDASKRKPPSEKSLRVKAMVSATIANSQNAAREITSNTSAQSSLAILIEALSNATPTTRIQAVRDGISNETLTQLATQMGIPNTTLFELIGFPQSSATRLAAKSLPTPKGTSEIVVWMLMLIELVDSVVPTQTQETQAESLFNAYHWTYEFLTSSSPALANATPAEYIDTAEGRDLVKKLVQQMAYGVYA